MRTWEIGEILWRVMSLSQEVLPVVYLGDAGGDCSWIAMAERDVQKDPPAVVRLPNARLYEAESLGWAYYIDEMKRHMKELETKRIAAINKACKPVETGRLS